MPLSSLRDNTCWQLVFLCGTCSPRDAHGCARPACFQQVMQMCGSLDLYHNMVGLMAQTAFPGSTYNTTTYEIFIEDLSSSAEVVDGRTIQVSGGTYAFNAAVYDSISYRFVRLPQMTPWGGSVGNISREPDGNGGTQGMVYARRGFLHGQLRVWTVLTSHR